MSIHYTLTKVDKADGEATVLGELTLEYLKECRSEALKELNLRTTLPGFRAGHIPEETLAKNLGEMRILEETAEVALGREYGNIVKELHDKHHLHPLGRPTVSITKLAPGIPLEFKMAVTLEPEFDLPDYKKLAKEVAPEDKLEVSEKEIDAVLEEIKKRDWKPNLKEGEDLREKVKENLTEEKKFRNKEKSRLQIVENLVKATKLTVPKILVEAELEKMVGQFKQDVTQHGLKWDEYLKSINKTEEAIRKEWDSKALDRAKAELIISKIAETEKLEPQVEELEKETEHLLSHYKDADPLRARVYVYQLMRNEKVLEFLEGLTSNK